MLPCLGGQKQGVKRTREIASQSEVICFCEPQCPLPQDRAHGLHRRLDDTLWGTLGPLMCSEQLTACLAFYMHILHALKE